MSIIHKEYITVVSEIKKYDRNAPVPDPDNPFPPFTDPPDSTDVPTVGDSDSNPIINSNVIARAKLPLWFTNAQSKYKKIIRVLGTTVNKIELDENSNPTLKEVPVDPGYRLFSNIVTNSNVVMVSTRGKNYFTIWQKVTGKEGFLMMVNNYNSVKEYDVTMENLQEVKFYIRPWNGFTDQRFPSYVDFVCELELMIVDDSF